jgi:hypothetical protein
MRATVTLILALLATAAHAADMSPTAEAVIPAADVAKPLSRLLGEGPLPPSFSKGQCYEWKWRKDGANTLVTACEFAMDGAELEQLPVFRNAALKQRPTAIVAPTLAERRYVAVPDRWTDFKPRKVYFKSPPEAWTAGDLLVYTDGDETRYVAMRADGNPK